MSERNINFTRRKFMMVSSAAVAAAPFFMNLSGMVPEAKAAVSGKLYFITGDCVGCQTCRLFCPAGAIRFADCKNEIMQDKCLHCGTCYSKCPVGAVSETIV